MYDSWARQGKANDSREDHESTSLIPKSVRSRQAISSCALGSEEHLRTASRHTQRGERHTPKDRRILPLSIIQIVEWFDLYVFGFDLYVFLVFSG